jgi:hypothetical protein
MEIFCRLLFGHLLADFTFQTNYIADWKRRSVAGLLVHVGIQPLCDIAILWRFMPQTWVSWFGFALNGWVCVAIVTVLHYAEDWFRVSRINHGWHDNSFFYVCDQTIHIIVLLLISPWRSQPLMSTWPLLGCLFVVVTHFATVTIWFVEKDIIGRGYPEAEEKYTAILQRLIVWLAFFLPNAWWLFVPLFVLVFLFRHMWKQQVAFTWTGVVMGNALALACGLVGRFTLGYHF